MYCCITNMFTDLLFTTDDMKRLVKVPQRDLNAVYNVLHLVLLVKINNINLKTTINANNEKCV